MYIKPVALDNLFQVHNHKKGKCRIANATSTAEYSDMDSGRGIHSGHHCDTTNGTNLSFFDSIEETIISLLTDGRNCSGINFLIALNRLEQCPYAFNIDVCIFRISWVSIPDDIIYNLNYKVN